jgi:hypothetical protein
VGDQFLARQIVQARSKTTHSVPRFFEVCLDNRI